VSPLRAEPRNLQDLMVAGANNWIVTLNNVSSLPAWLSDGLCQLACGGGFGARAHYSNDEEAFLEAQRPILLNGISDFIDRPDLNDRCVFLHLPRFKPGTRRAEKEFFAAFEAERPKIFGALLDIVSGAARELPSVRFADPPRMYDYALFGESAWRSLGNPAGEFEETYAENRKFANVSALEDSPVASSVRDLIKTTGKWEGTASQLLGTLETSVGEKVVKSKGWPKSPSAMSSIVKRLAPSLREAGIGVEFLRLAKTRTINFATLESAAQTPSSPSSPSSTLDSKDETNDGIDRAAVIPPSSGASSPSSDRHPVRSPKRADKKRVAETRDVNDDDDDVITQLSNGDNRDWVEQQTWTA
jgi:hypothetical protein